MKKPNKQLLDVITLIIEYNEAIEHLMETVFENSRQKKLIKSIAANDSLKFKRTVMGMQSLDELDSVAVLLRESIDDLSKIEF